MVLANRARLTRSTQGLRLMKNLRDMTSEEWRKYTEEQSRRYERRVFWEGVGLYALFAAMVVISIACLVLSVVPW